MAAKLVVKNHRGGSRISLVGTSGTELMTSKVFSEPRAKGATLRSLKGLLGDSVVVEDLTSAGLAKGAASMSTRGSSRITKPVAEAPAKRGRRKAVPTS